MCILGSILLFLAEIVEIDVAEAGTKNNEICSLLSNCFLHLLHLFAFCWHTGDNVRLSDVVKLLLLREFSARALIAGQGYDTGAQTSSAV